RRRAALVGGERRVKVPTWPPREPLHPAFERTWNDRLAASPHANFAMRLDVLAWEASRGRHAHAALVDGGGLRGAIVLREDGVGWVSGWPWRWQAAIEERGGDGAAGGGGAGREGLSLGGARAA